MTLTPLGEAIFTDFFTKATYEEKEKVFKEVAKKSAEQQRKVIYNQSTKIDS